MTPSAKRHVERVVNLGCLICAKMGLMQEGRTYAHHCFDSAHRSDWLTVPLCRDHHQGGNGFHTLGEREFNRRYKSDELHLVAETLRRLAK